jgi:hypothetical protein
VRGVARKAWCAASATTGAATAVRVAAGAGGGILCAERERFISARDAVDACTRRGKADIERDGATTFWIKK